MKDITDTYEIVGGDYVEKTFGFLMALGFGAGVVGSGGLLGVALVGGLVFVTLDSL